MPFLAAIGFALAGTFGASVTLATATAIGLSVILAAANTALLFIEKALAPSFKSPAAASFAHDAQSRTVSVRQPVSPWRVIYGFVGQIGGVLTFIGVNGASNEFFHVVYTLAGHQSQSIDAMYFDGVKVPLNSAGDCVSGKFSGLVHAEFKLGAPGEAAFPGLVAAMPAQWTASHRQDGRTSAYVRLKWNVDKFPNGVPNITFDIHGNNQIYDPRGPSTGYSNNAALCLRDYLTKASYGLGCSAAEIDDAQCIASANNCDEQVALAAGGTEARYTANGTFDLSLATQQIISQLLTSMAGDVTYVGGQWKIFSGYWRPPDVNDAGLGDGDARDAMKWQTRLSRRDTCNGIKGLYLSPYNLWQPADYPAYNDAAYITEDNGELMWKDMDLPFTTSAATAQRIAKIVLEMTRRQVSGQFAAKLSAYKYQTCDVVPITHARFGWTKKSFKATQVQLVVDDKHSDGPTVGVDLTLREHDSTVYNWSSALEKPALPSLLAPPPAPSLSSVAAGALAGATYYVRTTYVNFTGETTGSVEASIVIAANHLPRVASPPALGNASSYNVYMWSSAGNEQLQSTGNAIGASWTLPASGLVAGAAPPTVNTAGYNTVLPGDFATGYLINVTFAPSTPYNGDFEQYADMQPVADGWDANFHEAWSGNPLTPPALLSGSTTSVLNLVPADGANFVIGESIVVSTYPNNPVAITGNTLSALAISPPLPGAPPAGALVYGVLNIGKTRSLTPFTGNYAQRIGPNGLVGGLVGGAVALSGVGGSVGSRPFEVKPKKEYTFTARVISDVNNGGNCYLRLVWYSDDSDLTFMPLGGGVLGPNVISYQDIVAGQTVPNSWQTYVAKVRAPANAKYCRVALYNWIADGGHPVATLTFDRVSVVPSDELTQAGELFGGWWKGLGMTPAASAVGGGTGATTAWTADAVIGTWSLDVAITSGGNNPSIAPAAGVRYKVQGSETFRAYVKVVSGTADELMLQFHRTQDNSWHRVYWGASEHFSLAATQKSASVPAGASWQELAFTAADMGLSAGDVIDGVALDVWRTSGACTVRFSDILGEDSGDRRSYWSGGGSSSGWNDQGALIMIPQNVVTYTAPVPASHTTAAINFSWAGFNGERMDLSLFPVPSGTQNFTGLTENTTYYFSSRVNLASGVLEIRKSLQSSGTAPDVFPDTMWGNFDGYAAVKTNFTAHTATVGGTSGGGGGGGDPQCPAIEQLVRTLELGVVPAARVESGMHLADHEEGVWNLVYEASTEEKEIVAVEVGEALYRVEIDHKWLRAGGDPRGDSRDWVPSYQLTLNTMIEGHDGQSYAVRAIGRPQWGKYRRIRCERSRFVMVSLNGKGELVGHNVET